MGKFLENCSLGTQGRRHENKIKMDKKGSSFCGLEVDITESGMCSVPGFGISGLEL